METGQVKTAAKLHDNSLENKEQVHVDKSGDETSDNELSDMDKLPNEILMKMLNYLDEKQLVKIRVFNSRWNELCCILLQDKSKRNPDSKLIVQLQKAYGVENFLCTTVKKGAFSTFLECFSPSEAGGGKSSDGQSQRPIPFSRFSVKDLYYLTEAQIIQFVSTFGPHMKFLDVDIKEQDCEHFQIFWNLLLEFAPNIQHLGIEDDYWFNKLNLFDSDSESDSNEDINVKEVTESFLQNLKSIKVNQGDFYFNCTVTQLLAHAPNVQQVLKRDPLYLVTLWQELDRAHLLKQLDITSCCKSHLAPAKLVKNLRLNYLSSNCFVDSNPEGNEKATISYLAHALRSSQDTLFSLNFCYLTLESMNFCFKNIKSLPNVRRIQLWGGTVTENMLERFSQLCPNTTFLKVDCHGDFSDVARILWTGFKGLKSLQFDLQTRYGQNNNSWALDSAISGYSQESIQIVQAKLGEGIFLEEARRGEVQKVSILDLKDLSRLELKFWMGERSNTTEKLETQLRNSVFVNILPQHIRDNPTTIQYNYD